MGEKGNNTGMGILCYLGILVLIPLLTEAKNDKFVKFHIKQGLVLLIADVIAGAVSAVPLIGWIAAPFIGIFLFILLIMGIVNVLGGKETPLPVIGQYAEKINI